MSDNLDAERERIRERKKRELQRRLEDGEDGAGGDTAAESPSEPIPIDDEAHFQEVVETYPVVLVDCYADWCGPCQMLEPTIESIAAETDAAVAKVDVDRHQGIAAQLGAQSIPTLVLFADGQAVERTIGVQDRATLENLIERHS